MSELNMDRISNGTLHKRLMNKYNEMKTTGLTEESVRAFRAVYENEPLSSILQESELIFREPVEGLKFFESIMCDQKIPPFEYQNQRDKLANFIDDSAEIMPPAQKELYDGVLTRVDNVMNSKKNIITLGSSNITDDMMGAAKELYDSVYMKDCELQEAVNDFCGCEPSTGFEIACKSDLFSSEDPNALSKELYGLKGMLGDANEDIDAHKALIESVAAWKYVLADSYMKESVKHALNPNLRIIVEEVCNQNYRNIMKSVFTKEEKDYDPGFTTTEEAVLRMYREDSFYEMMEDDSKMIRVVNANNALDVVEAASSIVYAEYLKESEDSNTRCQVVLELAGVESMTIKEAMDYLVEKSTDLNAVIDAALTTEDAESFFEFTQRGEATPTVRKSAGNLREEPFAKKKSKTNASSLDEDDEDSDNDEDDDDEEEVEPPQKSNKIKNQDASSDFKRERENSGTKPKLADKSVTRKIQDKAMDLDAAMQKKTGDIRKGLTEISNAGKAVLRIPNNIKNAVATKIGEWNRMDEEKRKQKILEPGYRSEIYKTARSLLTYGAIWQFSKMKAILFFIFKHTLMHPINKADKNRMKRIRNELTHELDTEIQVTEEKINDANSAGDQKQKYELMRIKRKLEAEKLRVQTNTKYI